MLSYRESAGSENEACQRRSELLRAGANLRQIQELLGHRHLDSTQRSTRLTAHELRGAGKRLQFRIAMP